MVLIFKFHFLSFVPSTHKFNKENFLFNCFTFIPVLAATPLTDRASSTVVNTSHGRRHPYLVFEHILLSTMMYVVGVLGK